ncbi:MAG: TIGR00730 family Rossman fold protein [Pseudomonadota bacterium]
MSDKSIVQSICVYCGSSPGESADYVASAEQLGAAMAAGGKRLVYGGGNKGIMGAVARGARGGGGPVTGVIPQFLMDKERPDAGGADDPDMNHENGDRLLVTQTMHERKTLLFEHADAFVAMPGGIGTLEELVEMMTWSQLGLHAKPIILGNIGGFWDHFSALIEQMTDAGFVHTANKVRAIPVNRVEDILPAIDEEAARLETLRVKL